MGSLPPGKIQKTTRLTRLVLAKRSTEDVVSSRTVAAISRDIKRRKATMTTLTGEHTALLAKRSYEEEAIAHLEAQADAGRACGGIAGRHKDPQHQECPAKDMGWTCSSSAAIILLAVLIVLPLALVSYPMGGESSELVASLPILGSSKKNKKKKHHNDEQKDECESDPKYSKRTVKTAYELPFAALFRNNRGQKKFEASSVTIVDNTVYAVCDSSFAISKFHDSLLPFSSDNVQIGSPERDGDVESGYEAIFNHEGSFYVVRESILHHDHGSDDDVVGNGENEDEPGGSDENHSFHAIIEELVLGDDDYTVQSQCSSEFEFEGASKGFEGAVGFPDATGELYILGLCEGNHCSETRKADVGNGRMVLMKKKVGDDIPGGCIWETLRKVNIPSSAAFIDYSAIDISNEGRVVITSQENSALWLGQVTGIANGVIDPDAFEFEESGGKVLQFPKSEDCHTVYCNIEGIHWMNTEMLLAVSDKMKGRGKQDYRCLEKDQSIHAFVLP